MAKFAIAFAVLCLVAVTLAQGVQQGSGVQPAEPADKKTGDLQTASSFYGYSPYGIGYGYGHGIYGHHGYGYGYPYYGGYYGGYRSYGYGHGHGYPGYGYGYGFYG